MSVTLFSDLNWTGVPFNPTKLDPDGMQQVGDGPTWPSIYPISLSLQQLGKMYYRAKFMAFPDTGISFSIPQYGDVDPTPVATAFSDTLTQILPPCGITVSAEPQKQILQSGQYFRGTQASDGYTTTQPSGVQTFQGVFSIFDTELSAPPLMVSAVAPFFQIINSLQCAIGSGGYYPSVCFTAFAPGGLLLCSDSDIGAILLTLVITTIDPAYTVVAGQTNAGWYSVGPYNPGTDSEPYAIDIMTGPVSPESHLNIVIAGQTFAVPLFYYLRGGATFDIPGHGPGPFPNPDALPSGCGFTTPPDLTFSADIGENNYWACGGLYDPDSGLYI